MRVEPKHSLLAKITLSLFSLALTLGTLECGVRAYDRQYSFENFLLSERTLFSSGYPSQYDAELGWIPLEGFSGLANIWETVVTIGEHGVRSNGPGTIKFGKESRPILAVGDSFTFGDQVSNHETWPALLERRLEQPVVNGGVFGFGLDQAYLQARRLAEIYHPRVLIFSFLFDDIRRCELSERTAVAKPYFAIKDGKLELRNTPVPPLSVTGDLDLVRGLLGHSYALHTLMMARFKGLWLLGRSWMRQTRVHNDGSEVSCRLFHQLEEWAPGAGIEEVYVLIQYTDEFSEQELSLVYEALHCLQQTSLRVVDLRPTLLAVKARDPHAFTALFNAHMTLAGNQLVARELYDALKTAEQSSATTAVPPAQPGGDLRPRGRSPNRDSMMRQH